MLNSNSNKQFDNVEIDIEKSAPETKIDALSSVDPWVTGETYARRVTRDNNAISDKSFDFKHLEGLRRNGSGPSSSERFESRLCRRIVDFFQSLQFPQICTKHNCSSVPLISGLDKVIYGTIPASEVVKIGGIKPLRYFWYMLSGTLCDVFQFAFDYILHLGMGINDPSTCWALGFTLSISIRHSSHRYLVFGDYVGGYWHSLARMYAGYSIIIVISTIFNLIMTNSLNLSHYVAWVITLLWTGVVNYFILKRLWSFGQIPTTEDDNKKTIKGTTNDAS